MHIYNRITVDILTQWLTNKNNFLVINAFNEDFLRAKVFYENNKLQEFTKGQLDF